MPEKDAVILENGFPKASTVELRSGCVDHATGAASVVQSLLTWRGAADQKLFAATATDIYNITNPGALPAADVSSLGSGYWSHTNFETVAGQWLVAVNGVDKLQLYDGTTWQAIDDLSTPAITGVATTDLVQVTAAVRRLWFVRKDSMSVYYLDAAAIAGALVEFPLGQVFTKGGKVAAIGTWTIDGGVGADDFTVFVSSEGEIAVYKGTDPASSSTFSKVGVYFIGKPIGTNCLTKFGGDVLYLCETGLFPLSKALQSTNVATALTSKVDTAFSDAVRLYGSVPGWQALSFPTVGFVLVNIPVTEAYALQFVMNSITGAWCKFIGWNATCWEELGGELYFGHASGVAKAWSGPSDFGADINMQALQAYSSMGARSVEKHVKLIRPSVIVDNNATVRLSLDTDYTLSSTFSTTGIAPYIGSLWDGTDWDVGVWGGGEQTVRQWATAFANPCYVAALRLQISSNFTTLKWAATDFIYETGGLL